MIEKLTGDTISVTWHIDDVQAVANDMGIEMNNDTAREILAMVKHYHDASIGINWDVIEATIDSYMNVLL